MKHAIALAALAAPLLLPPPAAAAQTVCGERARIIERLETRYGERRTGAGLASNGVVEVFSSDETGTWTIIVTLPTGRACLVAAGESWEMGPSVLAKEREGEPV